MNLASWLAANARLRPNDPALLVGRRVVADYAHFAACVSSLAGWLTLNLALRPGDRIGLLIANVHEYLVSLYACWEAGIVPAPVNAKLHPREIAWILADAGCKAVLAKTELG